MDREELIRMAREAGSSPAQIDIVWRFAAVFDDFAALVAAAERERVMNEPINKEHWQRFEDEIRAAEREACAKVCDDKWIYTASSSEMAEYIRARSKE